MSERSFTSKLWRYPGPGGWIFVTVPKKHAPAIVGAFGRTPVLATIDGGEPWACGAGLLTARRQGTFVYYKAEYDALRTLTSYLWEDCCKRGKGCC